MIQRGPSPRALALSIAAGACMIALTSCAAHRSTDPTSSDDALPPTLNRLLTRAQADRARVGPETSLAHGWERQHPSAPTDNAPTAAARQSLDETVQALVGEPIPIPAAGPLNEEALKRYAAGRAALLAGDSVSAIAEFTAAHRADPTSPEPLRDLGEAHQARGEYVDAIAAFEKALERDPYAVRSLEQVGRHANRSGNPQRAANLLARAWTRANEADPVQRAVIAMELGRALAAIDRPLAAAQALIIATNAPEDISSPRWADHAALMRQRPDALRAAGDLFARADRWADARSAFDRAFQLAPDGSSDGLAERRVIASLRGGSPAGATQALVEACLSRPLDRNSNGTFRASPDTLNLIRKTAHTAASRPSLEHALQSAALTLSSDERLRWSSDIALAIAAAQPHKQAIGTLQHRLIEAPQDDRALDALLATAMLDSLESAARISAAQAQADPDRAADIARSLLRAAPSFDEAARAAQINSTGSKDAAGASLLLAEMTLHVRPAEAAVAAQRAASLLEDPSPAISAHARALAAEGNGDQARKLAASIPSTSPASRLAKSRAAAALADAAEALNVLSQDVQPDAPPDLARLLLAADLAVRLDEPAQAERLLHRAIEVFPQSVRPYESLIASLLARRPQAQAEADELTTQVRDAANSLRAVAPWSDVLQLLLARDLMVQRQWAEAAARLRPVLERRPSDRDALAMLLASSKQADQLRDIEEWITGISLRRTDLSPWIAARAFVLSETDRGHEAADLLNAALADRPHDAEISRALEDLYRARLSNIARADELALARLDRAPPTPETRTERAEVLLRARRLDAARIEIEAVLAGPTPRDTLTARLVNLGLAASAAVESDSAAPPDALAIVDALINRLPESPPALHRRHIMALVRSGADLNRVRAAAALAASRHASLAGDAYLLALDEFVQARRPHDALALARDAASPPNEPRPSLLASWILLAVSAQDGPGAESACRAAISSNRVPETLAALAQIAPALRTDSPHSPDELAYLVASAFGSMGLDDQADLLYSLALEHNPDHAWSNNNLGYRRLERADRFPEAYWMIVRAYARLPDDPAVIDSMGWARYHAGIFVDIPAAPDRAPIEGAVTLLQRAADAMADRPDPEVYEHLGDALFRANRPDDARRAWEKALTLTRQLQTRAEAAPNIAVDVISALRARAERLHERLDAIANNRDASTAKPLGNGHEPPRPPDRQSGPVS